ncbi:transcriptional regulator [Streptomyces sp. NPDC057702]|uniref:transcriptional regulator n=1 Tax=unclassified Streptomyces TaxID=2593676 RepID=UPI0036962695
MNPARRRVAQVGVISAALVVPGWPDVVGRAQAAQRNAHTTIGQAEVDSVDAMMSRLRTIGQDVGGQQSRPMAGAFIVNTVAPYLRASAREPIRKAMLSSAAMACYSTGWMAMDEGLQGLAQRYYVKGLELAGAADDYMAYCHILRGISVQAANLGHGAPATRYANAAADVAPSRGPYMRAFMAGQQAHGYAMAGSGRLALDSLRETERALDTATSGPGSVGGFSYSTLAYATAQVRYEMGDTKGSVSSLQDHFRLRRDTDSHRSSMIFGGLLAERQLEIGHLDAACFTWNRVLDEYPTMHSGRVDDRVRAIVKRLARHQANAGARHTRDRARSLLLRRNALSAT